MANWKPVVGFEGLYEVSDLGEIRSLCSGRWGTTKLRKTQVNCRTGYVYVSLKKNGKYYNCQLHRLVAQAFIENPDSLPIINHKDENPLNNRADNLEWCTYKYNNSYGKRLSKFYKPVALIANNRTVKVFPSIKQAAQELNIRACYISGVVTGKRLSTGGMKFLYAEGANI